MEYGNIVINFLLATLKATLIGNCDYQQRNKKNTHPNRCVIVIQGFLDLLLLILMEIF